MNKDIALICSILVFLTGCADTHQIIKLGDNNFSNLKTSDSVYISVSKDGVYNFKFY